MLITEDIDQMKESERKKIKIYCTVGEEGIFVEPERTGILVTRLLFVEA